MKYVPIEIEAQIDKAVREGRLFDGRDAEAERMAASLKYLRHVSDIRIDSVEVK
jgi:hypothetical protein